MTDDQRERWALILGASSGFGAAAAKALARDGYASSASTWTCAARSRPPTRSATRSPRPACRSCSTTSTRPTRRSGAASSRPRKQAVRGARARGQDPFVAVVLHSLAFGTTLSYVTDEPEGEEVSQKQLEMTADVMAHSLIYWVRDLFHAGLLGDGSRVFAMTSEGATEAVPTYGAGQRREGRPRGARPPAGAGAEPARRSPSTRSAPA